MSADDPARVLCRAGERNAERVEDRALSLQARLVGYRFRGRAGYEFAELRSHVHGQNIAQRRVCCDCNANRLPA